MIHDLFEEESMAMKAEIPEHLYWTSNAETVITPFITNRIPFATNVIFKSDINSITGGTVNNSNTMIINWVWNDDNILPWPPSFEI